MGTKDNGADGTVDLYVRNGAATGHQYSNGEAFDGAWHHVAWVDNDGILDLYIDGVFDKQFDHSVIGAFTPDTTTIGGILRGSDCCNFTGNIDDLAIWDEALSEDDIAALASGIMSPGGPSEDDDEDGLPDAWEEKLVDNLEDLNGLASGPGPGAGTGDFDGDGLTDLDEYEETKTDPTKADTDGDELEDGVETDTGTYVSATNTGTDPRNADTDGDGLTDGVETNTGELVDNDDTGTDPNNADTDGDGYADGGEIVGGTDPNDENSKGAIPPPFLYVDFEANAEDMSGNDYNGEVDGAVSFDVEGAPSGSTPTTGANFTGGHLDFFDIDMNSMIRDFEDGSYTFACWLKPIGSAGGQGFIWGQTQQGIHNGIRNGGVLHSAHWGADWNATTPLEAEKWVHAVWTYDGANDTAAIYLDGQLDGGPQAQRAPNGGGSFLLGARNNGSEQYDGYLDDVVIWREVLPEGTIQALAEGTSPIGATQEDGDGDGLPDSWEEKYGVDDPEGDDDNDGLTNADEFEARTKPNKADSDEDGLNDKHELTVTNTNPLNSDSDRDGILDGAEVTGGTDPNKPDTDGDGFDDNIEISQGTDPTNKNDFPQLGQTILFIGG
ncbi:MAG: LamG domain-containing protein, partial [Verrucomicrobiaceae bacterium]|nr:LamG domain-containing protein [Verrucomicrobiaceae bacterium]